MAELFEGWCILEVMGHRRLGGYVREQEIAGAGFLRIDVPGADNEPEIVATQFYPPASIYCLTPVAEHIARAVAKNNQPQPVARWELPAAPTVGEEQPDADYPDNIDTEPDDEDAGGPF